MYRVRVPGRGGYVRAICKSKFPVSGTSIPEAKGATKPCARVVRSFCEGTRQDNDVELLTGHTVARTRHFPTKLEEQVGQARLSLSWQISAAAAELLRFTEVEEEEEERQRRRRRTVHINA